LLAGGILASGCVMMLRVLVIVALLNLPLAIGLSPVLLTAAAVMGIAAFIMVRAGNRDNGAQAPEMVLSNPFSLPQVLRFGAILTAVVVAVELAQRFLGEPGLLGIAALSGLADVDAITLTLARNATAPRVAIDAILITVAVNTVAKTIYAWYAGGFRLGRILVIENAIAIAIAYGARLLLT
jgi:uncharacterized membrane protein (DUF4010 family)